jgi:hypothetical protein
MTSRLSAGLVFGITIAVLSAIAGCGGDGGQDPALPVAAPTSVSGTVAKGIVKQARVLVCRIVNGVPETDATCAAGSTGSDGSFSVTLTDGFTGPAIVKVIASETSAMLDETTGSYIPYDMTMRSVIPAISSKSMTYITPFSEMATSWTGTTGNDAAGITLAMDQVQQLISKSGVDLMVKPVIDLQNSGSDPVMLGKQANLVKQLARVTMMAKRSPDVNDTSGGVHCNTPGTSTTQQIACAIGAMSGAMTRGANAAAQSFSRIVPAMMAEEPTSVTMAIIRPDGTLDMEVADMTQAASMETAMRNAGMASSSVASNVQIMMLQMH